MFITDNLFWHGRIFEQSGDAATQSILEFTRRLFDHPGFTATIYQACDGLAVALRR